MPSYYRLKSIGTRNTRNTGDIEVMISGLVIYQETLKCIYTNCSLKDRCLLLFSIKVCEELVAKILTRVVKADLPVNRVDFLDIRRVELKTNIEVLKDSLW